MGARAVARLVAVVDGTSSDLPQREKLPATLVLRRSCGCGVPVEARTATRAHRSRG
jgi:DNA-binding LacI/PurR family transcriptional regulator